MSKTSNSNWETTVKPIVVLSVISLVVSLLLALVNSMTAPVIAENTKRTTLAAYVGVLPSVSDATELEEVTGYTTANVTGVVKAPDGSLAIKAEESGFERRHRYRHRRHGCQRHRDRYLGGRFYPDQGHRQCRGRRRFPEAV